MAAISSMTGFARIDGSLDGFRWGWELRSVNSKSLDIRFRLPNGWEGIEAKCKQTLEAVFKRGSINAVLIIEDRRTTTALRINEDVLNQAVGILQSLEGRIDAAPPRLDGLLAIRGVLEVAAAEISEEESAQRIAAIDDGFGRALAMLAAARQTEGVRIGAILGTRLDEMAVLIQEAEQSAAAQPAEIKARFKRQLATLFDGIPPLPEDRLIQEAALMIARADVREELDRLTAHLQAARDLLAEAQNIGRRLDFLCQEFHREANTLCSKSSDLGLTRTGLAMKVCIEQFREQVQNVE